TPDALPACLTAVTLTVGRTDSPAAGTGSDAAGSGLPLTATVAVPSATTLTVALLSTSLRAPLRYRLYAYRWPLPPHVSTANESAPAAEAKPGAETSSTTP
ncbi:MAG TPA: hypothetical protein VNJ31_08960, partial [Methyloceanibacter sp.]|nr:hypothetical protein [Methyloceanibacter sp.]